MSNDPDSPITNNASNYGAQGVFHGPVNFYGSTPPDEKEDVEPLIPLPDLFPVCPALIGQQSTRTAVLAQYESMVNNGHGSFAFLTGRPGHGRRALLATLAADIYRRSGRVFGLRFWPTASLDDPDTIWQSDEAVEPELLAKEDAIAAAWPNASRIAGRGWVRLVAQLAHSFKQLPTPRSLNHKDDPTALLSLLRQAARSGPVVLAFAGLDDAPDHWIDLLRFLVREVERDLQVLIVATLTASRPLEQLPQGERNEAQHLAHTLQGEGSATIYWIGPASQHDIADYLGHTDPVVARRLHQISGGIPMVVASLWAPWQTDGIVTRDGATGAWAFATDQQFWIAGDLRDAPY